MTDDEILEIFHAHAANVRELDSAWSHTKRAINSALVSGQQKTANLHTRMLMLVFSAWSEANFGKLIHTPQSFTAGEIQQIKDSVSADGIAAGWKKSLQLALRRLEANDGRRANIRQRLSDIIDQFVLDPSKVRNKLAHGQWAVAMNRSRTKILPLTTAEIESFDVVRLEILKIALKGLANIMWMLIQSPNRGFNNNYDLELQRIEDHLRDTSTWTLEKRIEALKLKKSRMPRRDTQAGRETAADT